MFTFFFCEENGFWGWLCGRLGIARRTEPQQGKASVSGVRSEEYLPHFHVIKAKPIMNNILVY